MAKNPDMVEVQLKDAQLQMGKSLERRYVYDRLAAPIVDPIELVQLLQVIQRSIDIRCDVAFERERDKDRDSEDKGTETKYLSAANIAFTKIFVVQLVV